MQPYVRLNQCLRYGEICQPGYDINIMTIFITENKRANVSSAGATDQSTERKEVQRWTLHDVITESGDSTHLHVEANDQIGLSFIKQLLMQNSNVMLDVFGKSKSGVSPLKTLSGLLENKALKHKYEERLPHPQDICLHAFKRASVLLRKHLLAKSFACKLAVPLIIPQGSKLQINKHAIQGINLPIRRSQSVHEVQAVNHPISVVSFVRISNKCTLSKSQLMNDILANNIVSSRHTFFDRSRADDHADRLTSTGLVEAAWYLPALESSSDYF